MIGIGSIGTKARQFEGTRNVPGNITNPTQRKKAMRMKRGLSLLVFAPATVAWGALPVTIRVKVDNHASVYMGDATSVGPLLGTSTGPQPGNSVDVYNSTVTMMDPYVYVVAWSDENVQQGLLAEVIAGSTTILSGNATRWEVFATGDDRDTLAQAPTEAQINAQIANANAGLGCSNGWAPISVGGLNNGSYPPCSPWGVGTGTNPASRWMWYNNGQQPLVTCAGQDHRPFYSAFNHCEYLIFRTKLPCVNRWTNAIAWWPFDEMVGPIADDIIGSHDGYHQNGATPIGPGCDGPGLRFDGVNDHVLVPHKADLNLMDNVATIEAIVDVALGQTFGIVSKGGSFPGGQWTFNVDPSGFLEMLIIDAVSELGFSVTSNLPVDGFCTCVAVTLQQVGPNVAINFFVNGVAAGGGTIGAVLPLGTFNTDPLMIGRDVVTGSYFDGNLDEVTLYDRALTANELRENCGRKKCKCRPCGMASDVYGDISPCGGGDGIVELADLLMLLGAYSGEQVCPADSE